MPLPETKSAELSYPKTATYVKSMRTRIKNEERRIGRETQNKRDRSVTEAGDMLAEINSLRFWVDYLTKKVQSMPQPQAWPEFRGEP